MDLAAAMNQQAAQYRVQRKMLTREMIISFKNEVNNLSQLVKELQNNLMENLINYTGRQDNGRSQLKFADLTTSGQRANLEDFINSDHKFSRLGGTTNVCSIWAVRTDDGVEIWQTPFDPTGKWVRANKRKWNQ